MFQLDLVTRPSLTTADETTYDVGHGREDAGVEALLRQPADWHRRHSGVVRPIVVAQLQLA